MNARTRLSVADARAIIGLPVARGSASTTKDSLFDESDASHTLGVSVPLPTRELGSTLKSRFAAIARKSGASRKEVRNHGRSLIGRRANLNEGRLFARGITEPHAEEKRVLSFPMQR